MCMAVRVDARTYRRELSLANTVPVEDDAGGFEAGRPVELDEQVLHHGGQVPDDLLSVLLHSDSSWVPARVGVHAAHHGRDGRFQGVTSWRVGHVGTQEDDWLTEHMWSEKHGWL